MPDDLEIRIVVVIQVDQLMQKLDEQLQLLRQATPLLRQRAEQLTDKEAAAVRRQLAIVLDQQTDFFESNMQVKLYREGGYACHFRGRARMCASGADTLLLCSTEASKHAGSAGESAAHAAARGGPDLSGHRLAAERGGAGRADADAGPPCT